MKDYSMDTIFAESLLETIPSSNAKTDYLVLETLVNDTDEYIRSIVAEKLVHLTGEEAMQILIQLTGDSDALVRANAFDSLGSFDNPDVREILKKASHQEPDSLARFYAIISYADLVRDSPSALGFFQETLQKESSLLCQLACSYALYLLGDESQLDHLLDGLKVKDYHIRCVAASLLQDIMNEKNKKRILASLYRALDTEASAAVVGRISQVLCEEDRFSFLNMAIHRTD